MKGHGPLWALYRAELRMLVRDGRTLLASVLLPVLILPLMFSVSRLAEKGRTERIESQAFSYAITGPGSDFARRLLAEVDAEEESSPASVTGIRLVEAESPDPAADLESHTIHLVLHTVSSAGEAADGDPGVSSSPAERAGADGLLPEEPPPVEVPRLVLVFLADWDYSQTAMAELHRRLARARVLLRRDLLVAAGAQVPEEEILAISQTTDLASAEERTGARVGRYATLFLLLFLLTGGSVVAADTLAGEKEKGTLETLLSSAIGRGELAVAKLLGIFTVAVFILLAQVANLSLYTWLEVIELPAHFHLRLTPTAVVVLLLLFLPLAASTSALLLWVSGRAASYKEFQVQFFPLTLLTLLPAAVAILPAVELRSAVALLPVANISVAVREVMAGRLDWPFLILVWIVSSGVAVVGVRATIGALDSERLMTAARHDRADYLGGPELFGRHVVAWFAGMWVVVFLAAVGVPAFADLRLQVLFNVGLIFLGGSLFLLRHYRLPARRFLWRRRVSPLAWAAVLLGAPSTLFVGVAVAKLGGRLLPMPAEVVEAFGRALFATQLPLWQLLLLVAVLPAIGEEVAFRGLLLQGLRQRHSVVLSIFLSAGIFALFHMDLFRLMATGFLGVVLAVVTVITGSVLPAMLWHVLNNGCALILGRAGADLSALDPWVYGAAGVASALSFVLLWREGRPRQDE